MLCHFAAWNWWTLTKETFALTCIESPMPQDLHTGEHPWCWSKLVSYLSMTQGVPCCASLPKNYDIYNILYLISFVQLTNITESFNDIDFLWLSGLFKRHALIFSSWCYCMSKYKQSMDKVIRYPEEPTLLVQKHHHNHPPLPTCRQRWSLPWQPGTEWCRLHSTFGSRMWVQHVRLRNMAKFRAVFELFLTLLSSPA